MAAHEDTMMLAQCCGVRVINRASTSRLRARTYSLLSCLKPSKESSSSFSPLKIASTSRMILLVDSWYCFQHSSSAPCTGWTCSALFSDNGMEGRRSNCTGVSSVNWHMLTPRACHCNLKRNNFEVIVVVKSLWKLKSINRAEFEMDCTDYKRHDSQHARANGTYISLHT